MPPLSRPLLLLLCALPAAAQPADPFTQQTEWARSAVAKTLCRPATADSAQARANLAALTQAGNGVLRDEREAAARLIDDVKSVEAGFRNDETAAAYRKRVNDVAGRLALKSYEELQDADLRCLQTACAALPSGGAGDARCAKVPPRAPAAADAETQRRIDAASGQLGARGQRMTGMVGGGFGTAPVDATPGGAAARTGARPTPNGSAPAATPGAAVPGAPAATAAPGTAAALNGAPAAPSSTAPDYAALNQQARDEAAARERILRNPTVVPLPGSVAAAPPATPPASGAKPSFARSSEDEIAMMRATFDATVARLVAAGLRTPGEGETPAIWNDFRADHGGKNLKCYDQAHELLRDLARAFGSTYDEHRPTDQLYFYDSSGKWKFVFTTYTGEGCDADGHYWVTAISRLPADDTVVMDPWRDSFTRTKEKNPIAIKPFFSYWVGRATCPK